MAFPKPGDTGIRGFVFWFNEKVGCGVVHAFDSIYGTPDANVVSAQGFNPLTFQFQGQQDASFNSGDQVVFDVSAINGIAVAVNVQSI